jgi:hypothetical protein
MKIFLKADIHDQEGRSTSMLTGSGALFGHTLVFGFSCFSILVND